jgi:L-lysine exporter family protein LysE/ArgO
MNFPELFITGFLLSLSLCLDIGVVNVALINTAIRNGTRAAALFAFGSCIGDLIYAVASLFGIGLLLQYNSVRLTLYILGASVLLVMSWVALRSALKVSDKPQSETQPPTATPNDSGKLFFYGLGLTLASPSAIIWFAAVGGSLIAQSGAHTPVSLVALFSGFFCAGISWCIFVISLAAYGGRVLGPRFQQGCHLLSALLFLYFAARIIFALFTTVHRSL